MLVRRKLAKQYVQFFFGADHLRLYLIRFAKALRDIPWSEYQLGIEGSRLPFELG